MNPKRTILVAILLLGLSALACGLLGGGEEEATEVPPAEAAPEEPAEKSPCGDGVCDETEKANPGLCPQDCPKSLVIDLTGTWNSPEWGMLELVQTGDTVKGTYIYHGGQIEGTLEGNKLTYRWWEYAPGQPYETVTDPNSRGDGYFLVSPDGNHLEGEWRFSSNKAWDGTWTADRQ